MTHWDLVTRSKLHCSTCSEENTLTRCVSLFFLLFFFYSHTLSFLCVSCLKVHSLTLSYFLLWWVHSCIGQLNWLMQSLVLCQLFPLISSHPRMEWITHPMIVPTTSATSIDCTSIHLNVTSIHSCYMSHFFILSRRRRRRRHLQQQAIIASQSAKEATIQMHREMIILFATFFQLCHPMHLSHLIHLFIQLVQLRILTTHLALLLLLLPVTDVTCLFLVHQVAHFLHHRVSLTHDPRSISYLACYLQLHEDTKKKASKKKRKKKKKKKRKKRKKQQYHHHLCYHCLFRHHHLLLLLLLPVFSLLSIILPCLLVTRVTDYLYPVLCVIKCVHIIHKSTVILNPSIYKQVIHLALSLLRALTAVTCIEKDEQQQQQQPQQAQSSLHRIHLPLLTSVSKMATSLSVLTTFQSTLITLPQIPLLMNARTSQSSISMPMMHEVFIQSTQWLTI